MTDPIETSEIDIYAKKIQELRNLGYRDMLKGFEIQKRLIISRMVAEIAHGKAQEAWDLNRTGEEFWASKDQGEEVRLQKTIISIPSPKMAVLYLDEMSCKSGFPACVLWFLNPTGTETQQMEVEFQGQLQTPKERNVENQLRGELARVKQRIAELEAELAQMKEGQK